jgi:hypothetical protein
MNPASQARVVLVGKPDCTLCDQAQEVIIRVCTDLQVSWARISIFDDPKIAAEYFERIPVTLIDGKVHDQFSVSEARLRTALAG